MDGGADAYRETEQHRMLFPGDGHAAGGMPYPGFGRQELAWRSYPMGYRHPY